MSPKPTYEELERRVAELEGRLFAGDARAGVAPAGISLAQVLDGMAIPAFVIDETHAVTHWNRACESLTAIPAAGMIGTRDAWKAFYDTRRPVLAELIVDRAPETVVAVHYGDKCSRSELLADALESQDFFPRLGSGGKWLFFTATPLKDPRGEIVGAVETFQDITRLKRVEKHLVESEETLRRITASARDAIVMMDHQGRVTFWNPSAEKIFGYPAEEILGRELHAVLAPRRFRRRYETSLDTYRRFGRGPNLNKIIELSAVRKDGREFPVELSLSAVKIREKWHAIGIVRDITERKKVEGVEKEMLVRLQQSQKFAALGNLAGGISHDFNNLLFPIVGLSEMLMEDLPPGSPERSRARQIHDAGKRGSELVKQILAFSRQSEHRKTPIAVQQVLKEVLRLSRSVIPADIDIRQHVQGDCGMVQADPTQIHQIAMNLITNAYHALEESGGRITVDLEQVELRASDPPVRGLSPGGYALLRVTDTGKGISPEIMDKIFEPYFTTKKREKGTGLGLAVVYGIVRDHGGDIRFESEMGRGTRFEVFLPLMETGTRVRPEEKAGAVQRGSESILLVDDEGAIAELEKQMLQRLGYRVTSRTGSLDALETFEARPGAFDLVITDMNMPHMTGDQLARRLIAIEPELPVVICTGFSDRIDEERADALGIAGFLMKPVVRSELAGLVRRVLDAADVRPARSRRCG